MTLQERLEKLTASEILSKFFVNYLPTGNIGKEIEMLSLAITEGEKAIVAQEERKDLPGISKQEKQSIIEALASARESLETLIARRDLLLEEKDLIYEAYMSKLHDKEIQVDSPKKRTAKSMVFGADQTSDEDKAKAKTKEAKKSTTSNAQNQDKAQSAQKQLSNVSAEGTPTYLNLGSNSRNQLYTQPPEEAINEVGFNIASAQAKASAPLATSNAPFDRRLIRSDLFLNGADRIPLSSDEASPILADLIDFAVNKDGKNPNHVVPASKNQYEALSRNADLYGSLSLINPYTVTRLYHGLDDLELRGGAVRARTNRMLDIRDQKRFYDIKSSKDNNNDLLNVSNPTTTNIIQLMNNDRWGRTPYSYQDFVFCKYFGRIPNNRMITLRKYVAPTYDNLCWELMGSDVNNKLESKFAPIATCVTYFGGDTGNNLADIFKIKSGLNWGKVKAEIWGVNGDAGTQGTGQGTENVIGAATGNFGDPTNNIFGDVFPTIGKISSKTLSLAKFFGITKSPNAFDENAANAGQLFQGLHDPNTNGPFSNRIQGPLNRIDEVYKREVGIKFENSITLKFAYKAHPIGGINTKAVMLDIISNMLTMCSATAVFWGGGHRFMITPREYPWTSSVPGGPGLLKDMYNGKFFGKDGAIRKALDGFINAGGSSGSGGWNWNTALNALGNLGMGVLGVLSGAVNTLLGSLSGQLAGEMQNAANNLLQQIGGKTGGSKSSFEEGKKMFTNIMSNSQAVWRSNALKQSVLPSVQGMKSILIGAPVGNWHLTVGNPLNPIAVIGNLICEVVTFNFGQELGPDDFPDELEATVTLQHGMARDLDAIESMFNRGAGRIYQAPDYAKMFAGQVASDQETRVDAVTGGTSARTPMAFTRVDSASALKYAGKNGVVVNSKGTVPQNHGSSDTNIVTPLANIDVVDLDYTDATRTSLEASRVRAMYAGNWATRKMTEG